jgi:hypothetical protein
MRHKGLGGVINFGYIIMSRPATVRLEAQCLNHYATVCPNSETVNPMLNLSVDFTLMNFTHPVSS